MEGALAFWLLNPAVAWWLTVMASPMIVASMWVPPQPPKK